MPSDEIIAEEGFIGRSVGCNGVVLVHSGPECDRRAARLLSWYDARTHVAPHEQRCVCGEASGTPDPSCPLCHGSGRRLVMDNPDAKYTSARRVATWPTWPVRRLAEFVAAQCQVIVTPDGEWHDRGNLDTRDWFDEAYYLLSDHAHFTVLGYRFALVGSDGSSDWGNSR